MSWLLSMSDANDVAEDRSVVFRASGVREVALSELRRRDRAKRCPISSLARRCVEGGNGQGGVIRCVV